MMNGLLALPQWYVFMDNPSDSWLGFINAVYWLGMGISLPLTAAVSNKYGRRLGIHIGNVVLILGVVLQTAANNTATFILGRFFLGVAAAWYGSNVPLLINEVAYPTHRGIASSLYNCGWYVGSLVAACATFGTRDYESSWGWRIPSLLQVLLPLVALPGVLISPESPRWLISANRHEEARKILTHYHAGGDPDSMALVNYEIIEIESTIASEKAAHDSTSYMDMIKTKGNRHRLLISITLGIFAQWVGNGVVSYYLALVLSTVGITSVTHQLLISAGLQIWNLIFAVVAASSVDALGRRPLFLASAAIMLVSFIIVTGLSGAFAATGNSITGTVVIPFLFIFFAGYDIAL
jgi:MFS family permease